STITFNSHISYCLPTFTIQHFFKFFIVFIILFTIFIITFCFAVTLFLSVAIFSSTIVTYSITHDRFLHLFQQRCHNKNIYKQHYLLRHIPILYPHCIFHIYFHTFLSSLSMHSLTNPFTTI